MLTFLALGEEFPANAIRLPDAERSDIVNRRKYSSAKGAKSIKNVSYA